MKNKQDLPDKKQKTLKIIVEGRVQGVFYRAFTEEVANSLSLKGYVRNLRGGNVEVVVEGSEDKLKIFIEKLRKGPPLAKVSNVIIEKIESEERFFDFSIRY